MSRTELARELGIARHTLYKYIARGMPTGSLEAAKEWRDKNLCVTQTKNWRIDSNPGVKRNSTRVNSNEQKIVSKTLTRNIPKIWFEQVGWLCTALKENGVNISAEQLLETQQCLYMIYMEAACDYLNESDDLIFHAGPILTAKPGAEIYPSLIERLNNILSE